MFKPKYILLAFVLVTLWFQRHIFFETYDPEYMHDFYSFSQWSLPLSSRIMGDADLYTYSGYSLINDFKPFAINPETGVFAKLFFGVSAHLFGNQHFASPLFLLALLIAMDILAKTHFKFNTTKRAFLALFIFCSAEIQEQIKLTLLDLPHVALFAWHLVFLFNTTHSANRKRLTIAIAGLLLGLMTATKFGVYIPLILLADSWYLYENKRLKQSALLVISLIFGYCLPYAPTIFSDGIPAFLSAQKWIINFYLSSDVVAPFGMLLISAFTGLYKGWVGTTWEHLFTWNGEWAVGILAVLFSIREWFTSKSERSTELGTILLTLLGVMTLLLKIPFWPRYFIFLIPFFWLVVLKYCKEYKILILLLVFPLISTIKMGIQSTMLPVEYLSHYNLGAYEELYNYFSTELKTEITRAEFVEQSMAEYENLQPNAIETEIIDETVFQDKSEQILALTLNSPFGEKVIEKQILWIKEHGTWKINHIENISQKKQFITTELEIICVNPVKVQDWGKIYATLNDFYQTTTVDYRSRVMKLVPRDYCIPVGEVANTPQAQQYEFPVGFEKHTTAQLRK